MNVTTSVVNDELAKSNRAHEATARRETGADTEPPAFAEPTRYAPPVLTWKDHARAAAVLAVAFAMLILGFPGLDAAREGFRVHVAVHQQFAGPVVRGHGRNEPVGVEFRRQLTAFLHLFDGLPRAEDLPGVHCASPVRSRQPRTFQGQTAIIAGLPDAP